MARIVVLDGHTANPGDNPWTPLAELGELSVYDRSQSAEVIARAAERRDRAHEQDRARRRHLAQLPAASGRQRARDRRQRGRSAGGDRARHPRLQRALVQHGERRSAHDRAAARAVSPRRPARRFGARGRLAALAGFLATGRARSSSSRASGSASSATARLVGASRLRRRGARAWRSARRSSVARRSRGARRRAASRPRRAVSPRDVISLHCPLTAETNAARVARAARAAEAERVPDQHGARRPDRRSRRSRAALDSGRSPAPRSTCCRASRRARTTRCSTPKIA